MSEPMNDYITSDPHEEDDEDIVEINEVLVRHDDSGDDELENLIMDEVLNLQKKQDTISVELQQKLDTLLTKLSNKSEQQIVKLRMTELALSKILVFTHGKSQWRLVIAHHHMGKAYLNYKCYEQAIDHLTHSLKKNAKLSEIKLTKLYHAHILTTLAKCYYQIASHKDALQVLLRALDIEEVAYTQIGKQGHHNLSTLTLIAICHCKSKNYKSSYQFIQKAENAAIKMYGQKSKQLSKVKIQKSKILAQQKEYSLAIKQLDEAIQILIAIDFKDKIYLSELEEQLSILYQKNNEPEKQLEALYHKLEIYRQIYDDSNKKTLQVKRTIASVMIKHNFNEQSLQLLQQILENQQKVYGNNSGHVGKTLKMMGNVYISLNDINSAQHYFKKAQKILQQLGNTKLTREIKGKLMNIKQNKQKGTKINQN